MNVDKQSKDRRPYIGRMAICHIRVVVYEPSIQKRQPPLMINDN